MIIWILQLTCKLNLSSTADPVAVCLVNFLGFFDRASSFCWTWSLEKITSQPSFTPTSHNFFRTTSNFPFSVSISAWLLNKVSCHSLIRHASDSDVHNCLGIVDRRSSAETNQKLKWVEQQTNGKSRETTTQGKNNVQLGRAYFRFSRAVFRPAAFNLPVQGCLQRFTIRQRFLMLARVFDVVWTRPGLLESVLMV